MLRIELEREGDDRWIAEIPAIPGCMLYAETPDAACASVKALALRIMAERAEHHEARHTGLRPDDL